MRRNASFSLLLVCFFLSGLAGLIYQTAWTREFAFVFGTSNLAVATVLAAYMAGLAAGAAAAAALAHRVTRPLLTYGVLELGIGLAALGVPFAIHGSQALYVALLGGQPDLAGSGGVVTATFYLVCSFVILMVPTAMMGATLPLLVRHSVHSEEEIGGRIGLLYSINTAGAVIGTIIAAFVLLPSIGLRQTIWVAAAVNGLVFLFAWALARSVAAEQSSAGKESPGQTSTLPPVQALSGAGWILPLIFGSGLISFTYEVLWVRLLEHLLGGSVYAFSTMLASFLAGIALGAAAASRIGSSRARAAAGFAISQLGIAGLSLAAFWALDWVPSLAENLRESGYSKFFIDWSAATVTLFPAAMLIGATFPFAVRILARDEEDAGPASAKVYAVNTLGSVVGSIGAGFFIIPALGYAGTLIACVAVNLLLALGTASLLVERYGRRLQIAAAIGLVALAILPPEQPWKILRYSAVGNASDQVNAVRYLGVGRAATVLLLEAPSRWFLRTNGNPEGRISPPGVRHNQATVARWLGGLPSMARSEAKKLLVVGFGGGVALETIPATVEQIDVIELEPEVVEANRIVGGERWRDPLSDPRITLHLDDARNALTLTDKRFDAIVSQPSHPWSAGASHLYTQEFFQLAEDHLEPGGVFVQWIGLSFVDESLFRSLLATLTGVFEHVQVYNPAGNYGVLFLSSNAPIDIVASSKKALAAVPEDFAHFGLYHHEDVLAGLLIDDAGVRELARGAEINRDDHNIMQIRSPKILDNSLGMGVAQLARPYDPLLKISHEGIDVFYLMRQLSTERAKLVAQTFANELDIKTSQALAFQNAGKVEATTQLLDEVLEADPRHLHARSAKLQISAHAIRQGSDPSTHVQPPLEPVERSVVSGWIAEAAEDWEALRNLDSALAGVPRRHPLSNNANQLQAIWRIASDDPKLGREAVDIVDHGVWAFRRHQGRLLLRARASVVAKDYLAALDSLSSVNPRRKFGRSTGRGYAKQAQRLIRKIPNDPQLDELRSRVIRKLRAMNR